MPEYIGIFKMTNGWSTWRWLCPKHVEERRKEGWTAVQIGTAWSCDDCVPVEERVPMGANV